MQNIYETFSPKLVVLEYNYPKIIIKKGIGAYRREKKEALKILKIILFR